LTDTRRPPSYTGRFAPSPTGPLHFGSLVAALASYLDARHRDGRWLLRIEDLDPPRESEDAPAQILEQLKSFGLEHDGDVLFQSTRLDAYEAALNELSEKGLVFPCTCSRRQTPKVYPGTCRSRAFDETLEPFAFRLRIDDSDIRITDACVGDRSWNLEREVGDFIVKRKDGLFAYQLAVVVDDAFQEITHIVRGNDLLDSTPRQVYTNRCLDLSIPAYLHFPVITGDDGHKLSKQTHAAPVDTEQRLHVLRLALAALGQVVHSGLDYNASLARAIADWDISGIPHTVGIDLATLAAGRRLGED
jgi:glutamyl-Q tRNA(Asp) synthetase